MRPSRHRVPGPRNGSRGAMTAARITRPSGARGSRCRARAWREDPFDPKCPGAYFTRMEKCRLPVGIQTLGTIRARNCYYVDKTPHVLRLVEEGSHYFLWRSRYSAAVMIFSITAAKLGMGCPATQAHHIVRETKVGPWRQFPLWDPHGC